MREIRSRFNASEISEMHPNKCLSFLKKKIYSFARVSLVFYVSQLDHQCVSQHDVKQYCCGRGSVQSKLGENSIVAMRKQYCGIEWQMSQHDIICKKLYFFTFSCFFWLDNGINAQNKDV